MGRLVAGNGNTESRSAFHVLTEGLRRENLTALLAAKASSFSGNGSLSLPEESIADTVIRLRMEDSQRAISRSIEIVKSRGQDFQMSRHSFRILDGQGLQVYRRVQAPRKPSRDRAAAFDLNTRLPTGIPGLDEHVNGGYFVGSTTVVAGISGVGKSVMGLQFIAEGALRGERSLMLSLDEQVAQIMRIDAVGLEAHSAQLQGIYDKVKTAVMLETDRPSVLRQAIQAVRKGGTVSIPGVYGGLLDKVPFGAAFGRALR